MINMIGVAITRPKRGQTDIADSLNQATPTGEMGLSYVNQRGSRDRADMQSRPGYLLETWVHEQLDPSTLQRPCELAQIVVARCIIAGHDDRVAAERAHHIGHLVKVAENRNLVGDRSRQLLGRQAESNDFHSRVRLSLNPHDELLSCSSASSHYHAPDVPALLLQPVQKLSSQDASHHAQHDRNRRSYRSHAEQCKEGRCDREVRT